MVFRYVGRIAATALAVAVFGMPAVLAQPVNQVSGRWQSSEGQMKLDQDGKDVTGPYAQDGGRVIATLNGHVLTGFWIERSSGVTCDAPKDGSQHWGTLTFTFNEDFTAFKGLWGYCTQAATRPWSGKLIARAKLLITG